MVGILFCKTLDAHRERLIIILYLIITYSKINIDFRVNILLFKGLLEIFDCLFRLVQLEKLLTFLKVLVEYDYCLFFLILSGILFEGIHSFLCFRSFRGR